MVKGAKNIFKTHFRNEIGRYVVRLTLKENPSCLRNSRELALQQFLVLESKFIKFPEIYKLYKAFMKEHLEIKADGIS